MIVVGVIFVCVGFGINKKYLRRDESAGMSPPNKAAGFFLNLWRDMAAGHYPPNGRKEPAESTATSQRRDKASCPEDQNPRECAEGSRRPHAAGHNPPSRWKELAEFMVTSCSGNKPAIQTR